MTPGCFKKSQAQTLGNIKLCNSPISSPIERKHSVTSLQRSEGFMRQGFNVNLDFCLIHVTKPSNSVCVSTF